MIDGIRKILVRHRDGRAAEAMMYLAEEGACSLGLEVETFESEFEVKFDDESFKDPPQFALDTAVAGYIGDVRWALEKLRKPLPNAVDYPDPLRKYMYREMELITLRQARSLTEPRFIKPAQRHKLFTGFVHKGDGESRMKLVKFANPDYDDVEVWSSEIVDFRSEYRVFVFRGKVLDMRRYRGDCYWIPDRETLEEMIWDYEYDGHAPAAYCLDVGSVRGLTGLVEVNDALSFGGYGLSGENYVRMLAARWAELVAQPTLPEPDMRSWTVGTIGHKVI